MFALAQRSTRTPGGIPLLKSSICNDHVTLSCHHSHRKAHPSREKQQNHIAGIIGPYGLNPSALDWQGIPVELRPWVWMDMCGALQRQKQQMSGYFNAMLQRGEVSSECAHQIELVSLDIFMGDLALKRLLCTS